MVLSPANFARPDGLTDRLAAWLREEILDGRMPPGSRIIESEIAVRCGVSRVPVREAFRVLAQEGLLDLSLHRGAAVPPLSDLELRELFGVRVAIEAFAADALARTRETACLDAMQDATARMRRAITERDLTAYRGFAAAFHEALVAGGGNSLLTGMYAQIRMRLRRYQAVMAKVPDLPENSTEEHEAILAAIRRGDAANAARLAHAHLDGLVARLVLMQPP